MTIEKQVVIDQTTILEDGTVLYRQATRIVEDGNVLSQTFHRTTLVPGQDITDQPPSIQTICSVVWTQDVVHRYKDNQPTI
jgi:hypothetical protein